MTRWLSAVLASLVLVAALVGCGGSDGSDETTSREAVSSAAIESTSTVSAGSGNDAAGGTGSAPVGEIDEDQADLQAELEAIERELDAMTLPNDADFGDIESALQ